MTDADLAVWASRRLVIAFGMPRSGSTWAYNVVRNLLIASSGEICALFCRSLQEIPDDVATSGLPIVIKSHNCSHFPQRLYDCGKTVVSIRDPRDAVVSAMQMFGYSFDLALAIVAKSANSTFAVETNGLVLKYEEVFADPSRHIGRVADVLDCPAPLDWVARLAQDLMPEQVGRRIQTLQLEGRLGDVSDPFSHDPETQWHPGHLKDGEIGKYQRCLSTDEIKMVMSRTDRFMALYYADRI